MGKDAVEIKIPLRSLAKDLEEQIPLASAYLNLPQGRKRPAWKREMMERFHAAASGLGNVSERQILEAIRKCRAERKKLLEISVAFAK